MSKASKGNGVWFLIFTCGQLTFSVELEVMTI
jgi:hypothetical protein